MVQMISEPMMPIGMSRFGLRASSAVVETASKPMYAKKTIAAPAAIPWNPFGAKGCQFSGFVYLKQTSTKNPRTTSLMATMTKLKLADSRIPHTSTTVITATMTKAIRLSTIGIPKKCGAAATSSGILRAAVV